MKPENNQETTADFLGRIRDVINGNSVRPTDLMALVKSLMGYIQKRFDALYTLVRQNEEAQQQKATALETSINQLRSSIRSLETALNTKKSKAELERDLSDVWDQIGVLTEAMPSAYNDEAVQARLSELSRSLEAIQARLNEPEEEDEEDYVTREEMEEMLASVKSVRSQPANMPPPDFGPFHESFAMDGSTTSLTLQRGVGAQGTAIMVRYNGQMLDLGDQYTVNGNAIALQFTPTNGTTISVTYWSN